ncbi:MAG: class I SAM-dependent methyltransferase [Anaerolineae bacterium]|jgi:cyclopropane fatty-acyl-phospholipid synthase-like methyltransferase|nr:class I SAM-dependent methyltransferase [Anaerolineae bacterium]MBT7190418.1 class I SAM-dependent methyltransferase [Anaerolineae bacterium]MBT7991072.1 class I SAM-dependent methyltransferase [Anaerolineae bacterium]
MSIIIDPEGSETQALFDLYTDWTGKSVLEIGSGDGRLTWRYASKVARILALEPSEEAHTLALKNRPEEMGHVELCNIGFDEFVRQNKQKFDLAVLAWSL